MDTKTKGKCRAGTIASNEESMAKAVNAAITRYNELDKKYPINPTPFETIGGNYEDLDTEERLFEDFYMEHRVNPRYRKPYSFD